MAESLDVGTAALVGELELLFKKAGLEVPAELPADVVAALQNARKNEIEKILRSHLAANVKFIF